ncbi:MAG: hypothetical protein QM315_03280 [Bacillota bacterium]|jgi:hypothetical protein|nr:hypothetical protein [Bacillota bacterium]NLV62754.1 hypothetical protein [Clostridiaceae bacterium]
MGSVVGAFASLNIVYGFIKAVLEVVFYASVIVLAFKGLKAINVYLDKNSK